MIFLKRRWVLIVVFISCAVASYWFREFLIPAWLCAFTYFDHVGYSHAVECERIAGKYLPIDFVKINTIFPYRIMQGLFMAVSLALVAWIDVHSAVCATILWWTGVSDILYYFVDQSALEKVWSNLYWTPLGIVLRRDLSKEEVEWQAVVGILIMMKIIILRHVL